MSAFFSAGGPGYLVPNPNPSINTSTSNPQNNLTITEEVCQYCAYALGDQFYSALGYSFEHRWRDLGIYALFVGSNLCLLFLGSRYLNFNRR